MTHDETAAIEELRGLSDNARLHISHFARHALCVAHLAAYRHKDMELAELIYLMKVKIEEAGL